MAEPLVMVVDDDPDIAEYFASFLEDHGFTVESAGSASSALELLETCAPSIILIDVLLPGRSGLDLLVSLRRDHRFREMPLVMVSGSDRVLQGECQSYLAAHDGVRGPDGVLAKPVDRDALLLMVKSLCNGSA